jgi:hypothetical protein
MSFVPQPAAAAAAAAAAGTLEDCVMECVNLCMLHLFSDNCCFNIPAAVAAAALSGTLEDCVMEYGKLCMRIHMGKNQQSVQLSSINLETMEREQPPPGRV